MGNHRDGRRFTFTWRCEQCSVSVQIQWNNSSACFWFCRLFIWKRRSRHANSGSYPCEHVCLQKFSFLSLRHTVQYIHRRMCLPVLEKNLGTGMCPCSFKQTRTKAEHIHKHTKRLEFVDCLFVWVYWCILSALEDPTVPFWIHYFTVFFSC